MSGALGVVRYVFPQLLAQLSRAVTQEGADVVARRIMTDCAPQLGDADLSALCAVLPALAQETRAALAARVSADAKGGR